MKTGYIYIVTNKPEGVLYIGVTSDLVKRIYQHREGCVAGFTKDYQLKQLVYYEQYESIQDAIAREKQLKNWHRQWKVNLVSGVNPYWEDLYPQITGLKYVETSSA